MQVASDGEQNDSIAIPLPRSSWENVANPACGGGKLHCLQRSTSERATAREGEMYALGTGAGKMQRIHAMFRPASPPPPPK